MLSKVILKVTKGELAGKEFAYSKKEQLFIGRAEDCSIVFPDKSVSRYHCMLEVTPPYVTVQDFGSLNGTFLNGEKIGQGEGSILTEAAQKEYYKEFDLQDGDILGLGKHCELTLHTVLDKGEEREKVWEAILKKASSVAPVQQSKDIAPAILKDFRKVKRLGTGAMSEVWVVQEEKTGKTFALKTMRPQAATDTSAKNYFLREASLGKGLIHRNVIKVYQTGCENGEFFILMELCEGGSVNKYMEKCGGKLPIDVATYIMLQVLDGLKYAHHANVKVECEDGIRNATGVVHRDFKPSNIFLADDSKYPIAKVADFGFAKAFETAGFSMHTRTGTKAGTPAFQPHQQIVNYKYSKSDVDVWAAAACYYNMLTGNIPKNIYGKDAWVEMLTGEVVPIRHRNPQVPEKLAAVIDQALVEKPDIKIKSAAELKHLIIEALPSDIKQAVRFVL